MSAPQRIQRKRTPGWRMPENAIYIGRPSPWGNPYRIGSNALNVFHDGRTVLAEIPRGDGALDKARLIAVDLFRDRVAPRLDVAALRGADLACWCPEGVVCHGDPLLKLANDPMDRLCPRCAGSGMGVLQAPEWAEDEDRRCPWCNGTGERL
jgi:hypothetical protein